MLLWEHVDCFTYSFGLPVWLECSFFWLELALLLVLLALRLLHPLLLLHTRIYILTCKYLCELLCVKMMARSTSEGKSLLCLQIKGGGATSITRTTHEWLQPTSITLNTWPASSVQLWHNAVWQRQPINIPRAKHCELAYLPSAMPYPLNYRSLKRSCKLQSLALQKGANTFADLLTSPSSPSSLIFPVLSSFRPAARAEGLP